MLKPLFPPKWLRLRLENGEILVEKCRLADDFWSRGKGLLGRKTLPETEGILLVPGNSIHMFGMKFPIDVIFLTQDDLVTDLAPRIAPGRAHLAKDGGPGKPFAALEVTAGTIEKKNVEIGNRILRESIPSTP